MPTFKCENKECSDFGKEEFFANIKFIWNEKTLKLDSDKAICPTCHPVRSVVKESGDIGMPWFKAENARNNNNKKIKKYDYDHEVSQSASGTIGKKGVT